jgi:hypothetical protein
VQGRELGDLARVADDVRARRGVAAHPDHLRVVGVADDHHVAPLGGGALGQLLHLRHERARRVNHALGAPFQLALHFGRDAVRADDRRLPFGDFAGRVDVADALGFEPLNLLRVVDEGPQRAHVRALRERALDHLHGALDAETEPVLFSQQNLHDF